MFNIELKSFMTKFHQLKNAGFTAHLDLHAHQGECWVGLRAQLGQAGQQPPHHRQQQRPGLRRSPAYARRQERRQAARQAQAAAAVPASEDPIILQDDTIDNMKVSFTPLSTSTQTKETDPTLHIFPLLLLTILVFISNKINWQYK